MNKETLFHVNGPRPGIIDDKYLQSKDHCALISGQIIAVYDPDTRAGGLMDMGAEKPIWALLVPISPDYFEDQVQKLTGWKSSGMVWSSASENRPH